MKSKVYKMAFVKDGNLHIIENSGDTKILSVEILYRAIQRNENVRAQKGEKTKYYKGPEVLKKLEECKYPFASDEALIRVRHYGAEFDSEALEFHCEYYGLKLKHVTVIKLQNGDADFVSVFEKSAPNTACTGLAASGSQSDDNSTAASR